MLTKFKSDLFAQELNESLKPRSLLRSRMTFLALALLSLSLVIISSLPFGLSNADERNIGSIRAFKSVPKVTPEGRVIIMVTVENNGTIPVYDMEVYEYLNPSLAVADMLTITQPSSKDFHPMGVEGVGAAVQTIINPPSPNRLGPGEKMTFEYSAKPPGPGDYQIPASLVWYTYDFSGNSIRTSMYSNGFMVHVPSDFEKAVVKVYPYALSLTTFTVTLSVLFWARKRLSKPMYP